MSQGFSVLSVIKQAYGSVIRDWRFYLPLSLVLFIINSLLQIYLVHNNPENIWLLFLIIVIAVSLYVKPAVLTHRRMILNENTRWMDLFRWRSYEFYFLMLVFGLAAAFFLFNLLVFGLLSLFFNLETLADSSYFWMLDWLLTLLIMSAFCQFAMLLPATAVEHKVSIDDSIALTNPHLLKLILVLIVPPVTHAFIVDWLIPHETVLYIMVSNLVYYILLFFEVSLLSWAYMQIINTEQQSGQNQEQAPSDQPCND